MSKNYVLTVRLPKDVGLSVERYAARTGHKPAHIGAVAVDEFIRRRKFPLVDFRETAAGRVAYVKGTRLAVYWIVDALRRIGGDLELARQHWDISPDKAREALRYAETYPQEIKAMREHAEENRATLGSAEAATAGLKASRRRGSSRYGR